MLIIGLILLLIWLTLSFRKKDDGKLRVSNGPKLTPEEQKLNYLLTRNFIEKHPDWALWDKLPEYKRDIELTRRYKDLEARRKSGELSEADYQIELDQLTKEISFKL